MPKREEKISEILKNFESTFADLTYRKGRNDGEVFEHFLEYIIQLFSFDFPFRHIDKYDREDYKLFYKLFQTIVVGQKEVLFGDNDWCDLLGRFYEEFVSGQSQRSRNGIFYTSEDIATLIADINLANGKPTGKRVLDPAGGSGRLLLAFNAQAPGNFYYVEEKDWVCCLLCVCNFILNGMQGEIVQHDSLAFNEPWNTWKLQRAVVNNMRLPLIEVKKLKWEDSFIYQSFEAMKPPPREKVQLKLFG